MGGRLAPTSPPAPSASSSTKPPKKTHHTRGQSSAARGWQAPQQQRPVWGSPCAPAASERASGTPCERGEKNGGQGGTEESALTGPSPQCQPPRVQAGRQTGRQASRQTGRQAGRQADRQTGSTTPPCMHRETTTATLGLGGRGGWGGIGGADCSPPPPPPPEMSPSPRGDTSSGWHRAAEPSSSRNAAARAHPPPLLPSTHPLTHLRTRSPTHPPYLAATARGSNGLNATVALATCLKRMRARLPARKERTSWPMGAPRVGGGRKRRKGGGGGEGAEGGKGWQPVHSRVCKQKG